MDVVAAENGVPVGRLLQDGLHTHEAPGTLLVFNYKGSVGEFPGYGDELSARNIHEAARAHVVDDPYGLLRIGREGSRCEKARKTDDAQNSNNLFHNRTS